MEKQTIGIWLRLLNNSVRRFIDRSSQSKREIENITCSNGWIIGYLKQAESEGRSVFQRDLEEEFGVTRSTASKVLILLEKKGIITRETVSHDARLKKLSLTDRSRELVKLMDEDARRVESALTEGFSPQELDAMYGYFARLLANIERAQEALAAQDALEETIKE